MTGKLSLWYLRRIFFTECKQYILTSVRHLVEQGTFTKHAMVSVAQVHFYLRPGICKTIF